MQIQKNETTPVRTRTKNGLTVHFIGNGYEHLTMPECQAVMTSEQKRFITSRQGNGWTDAQKLRRAQEFVDENQTLLTSTDPDIADDAQTLRDQLDWEKAYEIVNGDPTAMQRYGHPGDWGSTEVDRILDENE